MRTLIAGLGAEHHGDLSELTLVRDDDDTDDLTVSIAAGTSEEFVTVIPGDESVRRLLVAGHLLTPGDTELVVTARTHGRVSSVNELVLEVPSTRSVLHEQVTQSLRSSRLPLVTDGPMDSSEFDYSDASLVPWFDRPDAGAVLTDRLARGDISRERAGQLADFVSNGFVIIENALSDDLLVRVRAALDHMVDTSYGGYQWGSSDRLHHAHMNYPAVDELTRLPVVTDLLRDIFGAEPRICQTLTYMFGSQQGSHQDTIHLTPFPAGYMCGVWIAIDDVQPGSGELRYYPGSHRFDRVYMESAGCPKVTNNDWSTFGSTVVSRWQQMLADEGSRAESFLPRAGTALVWHENLMHEGSPRTDLSLSRRSIVSHYFASGPIAYYDSSGDPARFQHRPLLPDH